jgi:hypothetical protein
VKPRSILDPNFRYTPSVATDVAATFRRIRRELAKQAKPVQPAPVTHLQQRKA